MAMTGQDHRDTALERLINEPKGKTTYSNGQAFLLHVFWECPSLAAAEELLNALSDCAAATERDTPCVPVYFFRISSNNADLSPRAPTTIGDHPALQAAQRKLNFGVPRQAVEVDLKRQHLDTQLLDLSPEAMLPQDLRTQPVAVECTELYLDERAFNEHVGSRDYLTAYGKVMNPALRSRHHTVRLGTPTQHLIEAVLEPFLRENVVDSLSGSDLWRIPRKRGTPVFLSLDLRATSSQMDTRNASHTKLNQENIAMQLLFPHPLRQETMRLMIVLSDCRRTDLEPFRSMPIERGEIHCSEDSLDHVTHVIREVSLQHVLSVNSTKQVGYVLHPKARELVVL